MELLLEGYDHILDVEDEEDNHIFDVVQRRNEQDTLTFLQSVPSFEVNFLFLFKFILVSPNLILNFKPFAYPNQHEVMQLLQL
jgi:hypothetical protein